MARANDNSNFYNIRDEAENKNFRASNIRDAKKTKEGPKIDSQMYKKYKRGDVDPQKQRSLKIAKPKKVNSELRTPSEKAISIKKGLRPIYRIIDGKLTKFFPGEEGYETTNTHKSNKKSDKKSFKKKVTFMESHDTPDKNFESFIFRSPKPQLESSSPCDLGQQYHTEDDRETTRKTWKDRVNSHYESTFTDRLQQNASVPDSSYRMSRYSLNDNERTLTNDTRTLHRNDHNHAQERQDEDEIIEADQSTRSRFMPVRAFRTATDKFRNDIEICSNNLNTAFDKINKDYGINQNEVIRAKNNNTQSQELLDKYHSLEEGIKFKPQQKLTQKLNSFYKRPVSFTDEKSVKKI